jgi:hypothetical protein
MTALETEGLVEFLASVFGPDKGRDPEVSIYTFDKDTRIAEVSCFYRDSSGSLGAGAGFSFMRSEVEACGTLLACEDFCLTFGYEPVWEDGSTPEDPMCYDPHNEARWKLAYQVAPDGQDPSEFAKKFWIERTHPDVVKCPECGSHNAVKNSDSTIECWCEEEEA